MLAEATERTYRKAMSQASGQGPEYILDVFGRVMRSVESSTELRALTKREPMVFIKLAMMPGSIESISASITAEILQSQVDAGQLTITLSPQVLGEASSASATYTSTPPCSAEKRPRSRRPST